MLKVSTATAQIRKAANPIAVIEVRPGEQPHISLGRYSKSHPPKGFAIYIDPDPEPDAIVTQIASIGTDEKYRLMLHIANYGDRTVIAEVYKMESKA